MDDRELQGHLRLITMHRTFEDTLCAITAAAMADRPMLFARLRAIKEMMALEVAATGQGDAGGIVHLIGRAGGSSIAVAASSASTSRVEAPGTPALLEESVFIKRDPALQEEPAFEHTLALIFDFISDRAGRVDTGLAGRAGAAAGGTNPAARSMLPGGP